MIIQHNMPAMNTNRVMGINNTNVSKSLEKLSSGYRINRAGDDAAGLAISEKMRAQIRGLTMASKNSSDTISLVQTAEGALQESHNILQRMRELAVQSASDTNNQNVDREALELEYQQLITELDDTAAKTKFNNMGLIDGTFQKNVYELNQAKSNTKGVQVDATNVGRLAYNATQVINSTITVAFSMVPPTTNQLTMSTTLTNATVKIDTANAITHNSSAKNYLASGDYKVTIDVRNSATNAIVSITDLEGRTITQMSGVDASKAFAFTFNGVGITVDKPITEGTIETGTLSVKWSDPQFAVSMTGGASDQTITFTKGTSYVQFNNGVIVKLDEKIYNATTSTQMYDVMPQTISFQVQQTINADFVAQTGANKGDETMINIDQMNSAALGVKTTSVRSQVDASFAIQSVDDAVNRVSMQRAKLGALQNRLQHKIANLDTSAENLQSAEARIRDADMAKTMSQFSKDNILVQAATAMLAQANSLPQNVLQLLR